MPLPGYIISVLSTVLFLPAQGEGVAPGKSSTATNAPVRPRTAKELRALKNPKPQPPEPVIIDGTLQAAVGGPRVFVRAAINRRFVTGQPTQDVIQRARALNGDYMDLNLASSRGPQTWWTAVLDTGASGYAVNQETAERFGFRHAGDVLGTVSGVDGESVKGVSWVYALSIAGSHGHLAEEPSLPFVFVQDNARFTLELKPYRPRVRVNPDGANLVGMAAIRRFVFEIDPGNATTAMLSELIDMSSPREFEESLQTRTAGPRVTIQPAGFRPTNDVIRLPLRYLDVTRLLVAGGTTPIAANADTPMLMGVRAGHRGKKSIGNFIFDTGASSTFISRQQALRLGLTIESGPGVIQSDFEHAITGMANREFSARGYVIDSLETLSPSGQIIEWRNVHVLVHDVWARQEDGRIAVHDGLIGNNLFLPSTDGAIVDNHLKVSPPPFPKYWIVGPLGELWLQRPPSPTTG